jgi:hypothetical protein
LNGRNTYIPFINHVRYFGVTFNRRISCRRKVQNEMITTLYKSSHDYNILLSEIRTAKLAYHTYPLPKAVQPRLVLKSIPPNVSEEDIREELAANDIQTVKIMQLTKMDKQTRSVINKYPIFIVTFTSGTDMRKVFQLRKLCHCIIRWEKFQNSRPIRQRFNCQSFGHSSNFCGHPPKFVTCVEGLHKTSRFSPEMR